MNYISRKLTNLKPILCVTTKDHTEWRVPDQLLISNIQMMSSFLSIVVQDWERECAPFQESINKATTDGEKFFHAANAQITLEPYFLKCLFSYVWFFVSLQNAYKLLYSSLNELAQDLHVKYNVKHEKPPKEDPYVLKVKKIRDSVAHLLSPKRKGERIEINAHAAALWQPLMLVTDNPNTWNLKDISFHNWKSASRDLTGKVTETDDLAIQGIPQMHQQCVEYIDKFDSVCANYLNQIKTQLPVTVADVQYINSQP